MKRDDILNRGKQTYDPGKGNRTPKLWGQWLISSLQRQMLSLFQGRRIWQGLAPEETPRGVHQRKVLAKRRAKNKVARKSRRINRLRAH